MERDSVDDHVKDCLVEFPDIDPEVEAAVVRISRLGRYLDKTMADSAAAHGLNLGDYKVLGRLRVAPAHQLSPGDLGDKLLLSSGAVTNRLDRLEKAGLIVREPDARDRRAVVVQLTEEGKSVYDQIVARQADLESSVVGQLEAPQREQLNAFLRRMLISFERTVGPLPKKHDEDVW